ncbi:MAG: bifunctional adenosylcobinamide kinase/adenosylcobinamide-phosphate guanylyltransferase [Verrucomicrobiae bacterium]|nr:bifunctional adenosylcobinamide kinase/adenosylcobinamide-phosphate guanylyltransferase [Verrucomicrobiae bacterium]
MGKMILVTGGARSGKSSFAQKMAEGLPGPRIYVATCPLLDDEMRSRVQRHRMDREGKGWKTVEEPVRLAAALSGLANPGVVLVDCLTLWVNNLMHQAEQAGCGLKEEDIARECEGVADAAARLTGTVIMVTNEVGMGIVPENQMARLFRDLTGRCSQTLAARAGEVYLVSCGLPLKLK